MPRYVPLLLYVAMACHALAPTRRAALRSAVGALGLTTAQRAVAATNAEAEKVRVASRELNELLKNEDALRFKVLVEGSGKLPIAVSFITFQAVWQSNFARATPSRRRPRNCIICSMAWRIA